MANIGDAESSLMQIWKDLPAAQIRSFLHRYQTQEHQNFYNLLDCLAGHKLADLDEITGPIGIQGAKGSFNEEALRNAADACNFEVPQIAYLNSTGTVLDALAAGDIQIGHFAYHSKVGGVVRESLEAMKDAPKLEPVGLWSISVRHALMARKDVDPLDLTQIMAHPQVFKQCENNLTKHYAYLDQASGHGDLIDSAKVAEHVATGKLSKQTAVMGPTVLAKMYGLQILEHQMQDNKENMTSFAWVRLGVAD